MKRLVAAILAALILPACGGGGSSTAIQGGGSPPPPPPPLGITFDSLAPGTITPPAKATATFTLTNGPASIGINCWKSTAPNTLQFMGEKDTKSTATGTHTFDWSAALPVFLTTNPAPFLLDVSSATDTATYFLDARHQVMKTSPGGVTTGDSAPQDIRLFYAINYQASTISFDHAEVVPGVNYIAFPKSGGVTGQPGWVYSEQVWIYDLHLDTPSGAVTYTLNLSSSQPWNPTDFSLSISSTATYLLEMDAFTSTDEVFSTMLPISIP